MRPRTRAGAPLTIALDALSPTNIWAVGDQTNDASYYTTLIEHWDGVSWSIVPSPNFNGFGGFFFGINGVANNDLWAVGAYTMTGGQDQTAIAHFDGTSWSAVASPTGFSSDLYAVAALSSTNAWAVGSNFISSTADSTLVEHWDGAAWNAAGHAGDLAADHFSQIAHAPGHAGLEHTSSCLLHLWMALDELREARDGARETVQPPRDDPLHVAEATEHPLKAGPAPAVESR